MNKNEVKELNMEELEQVNGGVMIEAYKVLATGVGKVVELIHRIFH